MIRRKELKVRKLKGKERKAVRTRKGKNKDRKQ